MRTILFVFWLVSLLFAPLLARVLAMAISRNREYYADAGGAELTRNPIGLAHALAKIEAVEGPTYSVPKRNCSFVRGGSTWKESEFERRMVGRSLCHSPADEKSHYTFKCDGL